MVVTLRLDYHYHSAELSVGLLYSTPLPSPQPLLPPHPLTLPDHIAKRNAAVLGSLPCDMLAM